MTALDIAVVRPVIESEIDRLIAILDMLEPDPETDSEVETWGLPFGPCSPISTMLTQPASDAAAQPGL